MKKKHQHRHRHIHTHKTLYIGLLKQTLNKIKLPVWYDGDDDDDDDGMLCDILVFLLLLLSFLISNIFSFFLRLIRVNV